MNKAEKDIYFGASPEVVDYAKKVVVKMGGMLGLVIEAVYEKYGREAIDVIGEKVRADAREKGRRFREEEGLKADEVNVMTALSKIYPKSHGALAAAGLDIERIKLEDNESESHVQYCGLLEGYKAKSDKPWLLCEIFAKYHDIGFMEGVNPKLEWTAHVEKDASSSCLARGADRPCVLKLKLKK